MKGLPDKCLVDTNVPKNANLATKPDLLSDVPYTCIEQCVLAVEHITNNGGLVLDDGGEIFAEYIANLSLGGEPGMGNAFAKWVQNNQWNAQKVDRVTITKTCDSYAEFPDHVDLIQFDISDRKFIAIANVHPDKPPVLQATDSKWWGWKDTLDEIGITVHFLCPDYAKTKYAKKMGP